MTMDQTLFKRLGTELKVKLQTSFWPILHTLTPEFEYSIKEHCILSGGCFASLHHNQKVNDYDLWCKDKTGMDVIQHHLNKFKGRNHETGIEFAVENEKYNNNFIEGKIVTARATTLINRLQFIKDVKFEDAKKSFDFLHCTISYDLKDDKLYLSPAQMDSLERKVLIVNNSKAVSAYRKTKFIDRGWR